MTRLDDALDQLGAVEPTGEPLSAVDLESMARRWTVAAPHYSDSVVLAASVDDVPDLIAEVQRLRGLIVTFTGSRIRGAAHGREFVRFEASAYTALLEGASK